MVMIGQSGDDGSGPAQETGMRSWRKSKLEFIYFLKHVPMVAPAAGGQLFDRPKTWTSETLMAAKQAFGDIKFSSRQDHRWAATLPAGYSSKMNKIKEKQIVEAGARLAQVLKAIWP